jgi:uncharacterized protein YbcI
MKAKVRNYKLFSDYYDSIKGVHLYKEYLPPTKVNIYFDENMYIKNMSNIMSDSYFYNGIVVDDFDMCLEEFKTQPVINETMMRLETKINNLLRQYRNDKMLFLESELSFESKENIIILYKEVHFEEY